MRGVFEVVDLVVRRGRETVLDRVSLSIRQGELVGLVGPNGAGKTTLLRASLGLGGREGGKVFLFDTPLEEFHEWRRVAYVPQYAGAREPHFPATVLEVVLLGRVALRGLLGPLRKEDRERALNSLREVGLLEAQDRPLSSLSGGERQRVLLAKALSRDPDLLLLDEPTTGVDAPMRRDFYELLDHLNHEHGMTILLVSHDPEVLSGVVHRIVYLERRVLFDGDPLTFREEWGGWAHERGGLTHKGEYRHHVGGRG